MPTIAEINTGIATTLGAATGIVRVQDAAKPSEDEGLTEGIGDVPMMQVYWNAGVCDSPGETDRRTFGGRVRQAHVTYFVDVYARQRSHLSEDFAAQLELTEAVWNVLEDQQSPPFFDIDGCKALRWSAERTIFDYGQVQYAGVRFTVEVWVY